MSWKNYWHVKRQFHRFMLYSESSYLAEKCLQINPPSQMAISQIPALLWGFIFGRPSVVRSTLPLNWQFHRFHLWLLIFHSSPESSTFGRPWLSTSTPLSNGNFTDSCSDCSYFFPTLRAHHLADQILADLPLSQMSISQISAVIAHISFLL